MLGCFLNIAVLSEVVVQLSPRSVHDVSPSVFIIVVAA